MPRNQAFEKFCRELRWIHVPAGAPPVCRTIAREIARGHAPRARRVEGARPKGVGSILSISVGRLPRRVRTGSKRPQRWVFFDIDEHARGRLAASHPYYLYSFYTLLDDGFFDRRLRDEGPLFIEPAFAWNRPVWDLYFTQAARTVRNLDRRDYVREMARLGFTHLEINGLAFPEALEEGVPGEVYPRFYTYCPGFDQFVSTFLNRDVYPRRYLESNLRRLKENAQLAEKYGLVPTMTVFEPRSVPERLLEKYPELRGARVDHPFRSFKPRYNLAVKHPVVKEHYREMVRKILEAVPTLGCISIWTNDSGAGFEHTQSLYVGPNGSAYLVREWSEPESIVRSAADNVTEFLRLLQETGAKINPGFRVVTRLEPFTAERSRIMHRLGRAIDVEVSTMLASGWDSPYGHPKYPGSALGPFTLYNNTFLEEESKEIRKLERRGAHCHVMYAQGPVNNFEPLFGIPFPWLAWEKLKSMKDAGAAYLSHIGGIAPPASVPWNLGQEIARVFQFDSSLNPSDVLKRIAASKIGAKGAPFLVSAWRLIERGIRGFMPPALYFSWGVWYRILVRPLVPDIDLIPERSRKYYEDPLLATHHNPNRFDFSRDVLFTLMTWKEAGKAVKRIDRNALEPLRKAIALLGEKERAFTEPAAAEILRDQRERAKALQCWMTTYRNLWAWVACVHGYLQTSNPGLRKKYRKELRGMIENEIRNTKEFLALWKKGSTEFMAVSESAETTFIYDGNFGKHLERKIRLMERYGEAEPRIPGDVMWRVAALRSNAKTGRSGGKS